MWSNLLSQSTFTCTSWLTSRGEVTKCTASGPCLVTLKTGTSPISPWSSGWRKKQHTMKHFRVILHSMTLGVILLMTLIEIWKGDWYLKINKHTCPPPSGNKMVSWSLTLKPLTVSFFPLTSCFNSAGQQETTEVSNYGENKKWNENSLLVGRVEMKWNVM